MFLLFFKISVSLKATGVKHIFVTNDMNKKASLTLPSKCKIKDVINARRLVDSTNGCQIKRIILKAIVAQEGRETR